MTAGRNVIALAALSAGLACPAAQPHFAPFVPGEVAVGGEIGDRMKKTVGWMLDGIKMEKDFIAPFRVPKETPDEPGGFAGTGMLLDAFVKAAAHGIGGERTVAAKTRLFAEFAAIVAEKDYRVSMFMGRDGKWDAHETAYVIQAYCRDYEWFGTADSLTVARKLADSLIARKIPVTTGTEVAFSLLTQLSGDRKYTDWLAKEGSIRTPLSGYEKLGPTCNSAHVYGCLGRTHGQLFYADVCTVPEAERRVLEADAVEMLRRARTPYASITGSMSGGAEWGELWDDSQCGVAQWGETCTSAYLMRLAAKRMERDPDVGLGDLFERVLYNAFFAAQSADGTKYRYFAQFNMRAVWWGRDTFCCPNNYRREVFEIPDAVFFRTAKGLAVNLYAPAELKSGDWRATMETAYPEDGAVKLRVTLPNGMTELKLRIPAWCEGATVAVGAEPERSAVPGWFTVTRDFSSGVEVRLALPMPLRLVRGLRAQEGRVALMRGPCVYALGYEGLADGIHPDLLAIDAAREIRWNDATRAFDVPLRRLTGEDVPLTLPFRRFASDDHRRTYFKTTAPMTTAKDELQDE